MHPRNPLRRMLGGAIGTTHASDDVHCLAFQWNFPNKGGTKALGYLGTQDLPCAAFTHSSHPYLDKSRHTQKPPIRYLGHLAPGPFFKKKTLHLIFVVLSLFPIPVHCLTIPLSLPLSPAGGKPAMGGNVQAGEPATPCPSR